MSSDDPTKDLSDEIKRTTQPTITAVFDLVREVKQSVDAINARLDETNARLDETNARLDATNARLDATNARLDATNARLDEMDSRHARDFASLHARIDALSEEMKNGFTLLADKIHRNRLHAEADYQDLSRRIRDLETKAS
jgi:predicted nuclease with TOPRIM domain